LRKIRNYAVSSRLVNLHFPSVVLGKAGNVVRSFLVWALPTPYKYMRENAAGLGGLKRAFDMCG
jgi:hypothetical protein